jgi:hypothetical protein
VLRVASIRHRSPLTLPLRGSLPLPARGEREGEGAAGLCERSHAPLRHGQAHQVAVVQAVLELRQRWPRWGPKKLRVKLGELYPELPVPAASTIGDWLRREGLIGRSPGGGAARPTPGRLPPWRRPMTCGALISRACPWLEQGAGFARQTAGAAIH